MTRGILMRTVIAAVALLAGAGGCALSVYAEPAAVTVLVKDGVPAASIVIAADAGADVKLAAKELVEHLRLMSGAELPVVNDPVQAQGVPIYLGRDLPQAAMPATNLTDPASFRVEVRPDGIALVGKTDEGTLFAAYELLEQLGVRWFNPGELGRVVPQHKTVSIAHQATTQNPGFGGRILSDLMDHYTDAGQVWFRRMRMGGFNAGGHGWGIKADPATEPELYMTEDGRQTGKIRVNHPEVFRRVLENSRQRIAEAKASGQPLPYLGAGPEDGLGFGEDEWDAGDMDPLHGRVSITDRIVKFYNNLLDEVQKDDPNVGIAFYAYSQHMRPPVREKPNSRILPVLAPIDVCRMHSFQNPLCPERQYIKEVVEGWQKLGVKMMYRGYLFNLADQGLPFPMVNLVRDELPWYYDHGMIACRIECKPGWGYHGPALYLATKLMWEPHADADAILDDYFKTFFGPAAEAMRRHYDLAENAYRDSDYHTGNVFDIPHILTPEVIAQMEASLAEAERAAPADSQEAKRVHMVRLAFDFGKANLDMIAAYNNFDFARAKQLHDRIVNELIPPAIAHDPRAINVRYATQFMRRFWQDITASGSERVTGGNEIAVKLPDEWLFQLDPLNGGESLGFWKPYAGTNDWTPIKTYSETWSSQGLRYYKGEAWYRTTANVPDRFAGRPLRLWLGGVDDQAKVWINGQPIEQLASGAAPIGRPWEFDCGDTLRLGQDNVIVIKITNRRLDELGTGGLTAPAMIWAAGQTTP